MIVASFTQGKANTNRYLVVGMLASVSASVCCIGPLALLATGISGAWMSRLMVMEPFQPLLIVLTVSSFAFAGWKLFYSDKENEVGSSASCRKVNWKQKTTFLVTGSLSLGLLASEYWILLLAK